MNSTASMRKLLGEVFEVSDFDANATGLPTPAADRAKWANEIVDRLKLLDRVNCYPYWTIQPDQNFGALKLTITPPKPSGPNEKRMRPRVQSFLLTWNCRVFVHLKKTKSTRRSRSRTYVDVTISNEFERGGLWIVDSTETRCDNDIAVPVASLEQVEELIGRIKANQERDDLRHGRKLKITSLRQKSLTSQLKKLGLQYDFAFKVGYNVRDVNLSLKVKSPRSNRELEYHIAFPQGKFNDVLEQVEEIVVRLQMLADHGVSFQTDNKKWEELQGSWMPEKSD